MLDTLAEESHVSAGDPESSDATPRWERRFIAALRRLQHAGIDVADDVDVGRANYVQRRALWEERVAGLAELLGYAREQVDVSL